MIAWLKRWLTPRPKIDYDLCKSCGGTGWAYAATLHEGKLGPTHFIPCPACVYGMRKQQQCH